MDEGLKYRKGLLNMRFRTADLQRCERSIPRY